MAGGGLAKLTLEMEINGDKIVVNGLDNVDKAVERTARTAKTATEQMSSGMGNVSTATGRMATGIGNVSTATGRMAAEHTRHMQSMTGGWTDFERSIQSTTMRIMNLTMAAGLIAAPFIAAGAAIYKGVEIVDDFQMSVTNIAAQLTQLQGPKDVAKHYQESVVYAGALAKKLEEVDANSQANNKGLEAMLQTMTGQGVVLDVNNQKQVESFTALSNAIAMTTKGQDQQMQMYQEMRALTSGLVDPHAQVSRMIDAQIKQQGVYKGGLKEVVELGKQHGDLLERLQPYLVGINAATGDISQSWTAAKSSFETASNAVIRSGMTEAARDLAGWLQQANVYLKEHKEEIGGGIQQGWQLTKGFIEGSFVALQAGGTVLQTTIIPLFTDTHLLIKGTAETIAAIGSVLQAAPGLLVPVGVAAYYAVGGVAALTVAYTALTTTITASMAANPIGWVALGIGAIYLAAKPAVKYLDELTHRYTGLNITGEAYARAEEQRAAEADKRWEDTKARALWAWKEGGIAPSPGMQAQLSISHPQAPKIAPPPPTVDTKALQAAEAWRKAQADVRTELANSEPFLDKYESKINGITNRYDDLLTKYPAHKSWLIEQRDQIITNIQTEETAREAIKATSDEFKALLAEWEKEPAAPAFRNFIPDDVHEDILAGITKISKATRQLNTELIAGNYQQQLAALQEYYAERGELAEADYQKQLAIIEQQIRETGDGEEEKLELLTTYSEYKVTLAQSEAVKIRKIQEQYDGFAGMQAGLRDYANTAQEVGAMTRNLVTDFLNGMEDALISFVRTGKISFRSLVDSMINDIIRMQVKQQLTGPLSSWIGGLMSGAYQQGGSNFVGPVQPGQTAPSATSGLASSYGMYGAIAAASYGVLDSYFKSGGVFNKHTEYQKQQLGLTNSFTAGVALLLDKYTGGGLLGTAWNTKAAGLQLGIDSGELEGVNYNYQKKKKNFWRGSKSRTLYSDIDPLLLEALQDQYEGVVKSITAGSRLLGADGGDFMAGFTSQAKNVNLAGLSAENQQKAILGYFREISSEAIEQLYPTIKEFAKLGEDSTDIFQRLTSSLQLMNNNFALLDIELNELSLSGGVAADAIVQALGGLEAAGRIFNDYFNSSLFTEAEQAAMKLESAQRQVADTFDQLGLAVPSTVEEFKMLVTSQLALGAAGADTAATLLGAAGAFATLNDAATTMFEDSIDILKKAAQEEYDAEMARINVARKAYTAAYALQEEAAADYVATLSGAANMLKSAFAGLSSPDAGTLLSRAAAQSAVRGYVTAGTLPGEGELDAALTTLSQSAEGLFATRADYLRDAALTATDLKTLSDRASGQLTIAEATLAALGDAASRELAAFAAQEEAAKTLLDAETSRLDGLLARAQEQLIAINGTTAAVLTVADAIAYLAAATGGDQAAAGMPSYAVGTPYVPYDMPANIHQGEIIIDRRSSDVLRKYGVPVTGAADNRELIKEVKELRAELRLQNAEIAKNTQKTAKLLDAWDGDGLPEARAL